CIAIAGGGTAGWMAAAALARTVRGRCAIRLVESPDIAAIGVGEATVPPIHAFNAFLGLDEGEFLRATKATYKLAIQFRDWTRLGHSYFHPFGIFGTGREDSHLYQYWLKLRALGDDTPLDDYSLCATAAGLNKCARSTGDPRSIFSTVATAFHFDASLYAQFLRRYSEGLGVERIEGKIAGVPLRGEDGFIEALVLDDGRRIEADYFVDCTGFRGLLIEQALKTGYEEWTRWLPCDRAFAVHSAEMEEYPPYTRATALGAGWQWRIPLQHRTGNGYVYSSAHSSDDEAVCTLLANLEGPATSEPKPLRFVTGRRRKAWNRNCIAIGLSSGFIEPLESTSIHLIQSSVLAFVDIFPGPRPDPTEVEHYDRLVAHETEAVRDFVILHYKANGRDDAALWRDCRAMAVPDSLSGRMELFRSHGRVPAQAPYDLFGMANWVAVLLGQDVMPRRYEPLVDIHDIDEVRRRMLGTRQQVRQAAMALPGHRAFIARMTGAA
ncbi:MAG: tryptophan 7-halogenase, partial [Alphaproteobacteria bacterium]|nr:tryptophan 7-halogenase [Alphaproteobacteria bacterium]